MSPRSDKAEQGFTLLELMIAVALSLLITAGVVGLFMETSRSYRQDEMLTRMLSDGRYAIGEIIRDLTLAGHWSDLHEPLEVTVEAGLTPVDSADDCGPTGGSDWIFSNLQVPVEQVDNATDSESAAAFDCITPAEFTEGTDIFAIKRASASLAESHDAASPSLIRLEQGHVYLKTNGTSGELFRNTVASGDPRPSPDAGAPYASSTTEYWKYVTHVYYIRSYSVTVGDGVPTLCRKHLRYDSDVSNPPEMVTECLAEGVEDMQLEFGIDTDNDGIANRYLADPTAAQMDNLVSVRVHLLLRSVEQDALYTSNKIYSVSNAGAYTPNDSFYRKVLTTTVLVRNPAYLSNVR